MAGDNHAHVARHRLDQHGRDVLAVLVEELGRGGQVVVGRQQRVGRDGSGTPGELGTFSVVAPLPAETSSASAWP